MSDYRGLLARIEALERRVFTKEELDDAKWERTKAALRDAQRWVPPPIYTNAIGGPPTTPPRGVR
jgi:hypothetical protein